MEKFSDLVRQFGIAGKIESVTRQAPSRQRRALPAGAHRARTKAAHATDEPLPSRGDIRYSYCQPHTNHKDWRKLLRGRFKPEFTLDLHGLTRAEAKIAVEKALIMAYTCNYRCLCIIHGKGLHSAGGVPVLLPFLASYLRTHTNVLAFCPIRSIDGRGGKMSVLIRRRSRA